MDKLEPAYPHTLSAMQSWMTAQYGPNPQIIDIRGVHSFEQIEANAARVARGLLAAGYTKGSRIGVLLPNGAEFVEALYGVARVGCMAVLLSTLSRPRELRYMIRNADLSGLIIADRYLNNDYVTLIGEAFPALQQADGAQPLWLHEAPFLRSIWVWGEPGKVPAWARGGKPALLAGGDSVSPAFLAAVEAEIVPADPAVMIYTSGSTADPKAIVHSNGALIRQGWQMARYYNTQAEDRVITSMPMFWVGGLTCTLMSSNNNGAAVVCPEDGTNAAMLRSFEQHGVTQVSLWIPQVLALLSAPGLEEHRKRLRPSCAMQQVVFGLSSAARNPNSLGMTETLGPHSMEYFEGPLPEDRIGSFGRPVGGIERKIVDPATGATLPFGEVGELCVRGGAIMLGYYRKERSEIFDREGFFHTGDFASLSEDGHLFYKGRMGDMLKVSGANVTPSEVEAVLMAEPDIAEAAVMGMPHPELGLILVAAVVPLKAAAIEPEELRARVRKQLSSYKVPRRILVFDPTEIPRTASSKIRRPELELLVAARLQAEASGIPVSAAQ